MVSFAKARTLIFPSDVDPVPLREAKVRIWNASPVLGV
jgi:hypothetical protein